MIRRADLSRQPVPKLDCRRCRTATPITYRVKAAATSPSTRSMTPPWPGMMWLESLTPLRRLTNDSKRSPICATTRAAARPARAQQAAQPGNAASASPASTPPKRAADRAAPGLAGRNRRRKLRAAERRGRRNRPGCRSPRPRRTGTGWRSARHGRCRADRQARSRTARIGEAAGFPCGALPAIRPAARLTSTATASRISNVTPAARPPARPARPASTLGQKAPGAPPARGRHMRGPFVEDRAGDDAAEQAERQPAQPGQPSTTTARTSEDRTRICRFVNRLEPGVRCRSRPDPGPSRGDVACRHAAVTALARAIDADRLDQVVRLKSGQKHGRKTNSL